jgi:hypothetical protein
MSTESERKQILSMVESGKITPSQGVKLLQALDDTIREEQVDADSPVQAGQEALPVEPPIVQNPTSGENLDPQVSDQVADHPSGIPAEAGQVPNSETAQEANLPPRPVVPDYRSWRHWTMIPLWTGVVVTVLGGFLMFTTWMAARGLSFWFACAWVPFLAGIALIVLAWGGRSMRWLHIRIQQKTGEWPRNISISLPLPLKFLAWLVRTFGDRIPNVEGKGMDELILALEHTSPDAPFSLDVDEGEDGERVQVIIG